MRKHLFKPVWLIAVVLGISGCGGGDGDAVGAGAKHAEAAFQPAVDPSKIESFAYVGNGDPSPFKPRAPNTKRATALIDLGPLSQFKRAEQTDNVQPGVPHKIGLRRDIAQTTNAGDTSGRLEWKTSPSGASVATIGFRSPGAVGVRVGMLITSLPGDAIVRAYAPSAATAFEISGREILATIDTNQAAGMTGDDAWIYWVPTVDSSEIVLEIEVPVGLSPASVQIAIPQLSHLYRSAEDAANTTKVGESGSCEVDVSCRSDFAEESKSVARMLFVQNGNSYLCTGTLLADRAGSGIPYLLSANHCINGQATASTLETYWFYRSSSCNIGTLDSGAQRITGGATLLYSAETTDTTFLRLNAAPPAGAVFAGTSKDPVSIGTPLVGLHHPRGDLQKISEGALTTNLDCRTVSSTTFRCQVGDARSSFMGLQWQSGTVEPGSSGSSLFATSGGKRYVVGQLYGGSSSCTSPKNLSIYGRFDLAYNSELQTFLDPGSGSSENSTSRTAVYRFYNSTTSAHFFTTSILERNYIIGNLRQFQYEGKAFYAYSTSAPGLSPIFRFYNTSTGAHFYTINTDERNYVAANFPQFIFEGPTWYARTTPAPGSQPIYRFYNSQSGNHFYTISQAERNYILANIPLFKYEGEGYQGWASQ